MSNPEGGYLKKCHIYGKSLFLYVNNCSKCPFLHTTFFGVSGRVVKECTLISQIIPTLIISQMVRHKDCPLHKLEVIVRPGWDAVKSITKKIQTKPVEDTDNYSNPPPETNPKETGVPRLPFLSKEPNKKDKETGSPSPCMVSPFDYPNGRLIHPNLTPKKDLDYLKQEHKDLKRHAELLDKLQLVIKELEKVLELKKEKKKTKRDRLHFLLI